MNFNPFLLTYSSHSLVSALHGQLFSQPGHLIRGLSNGLRYGDQLFLAAAVLLREKNKCKLRKSDGINCIYLNQLRQFSHEQRHLLGRRNDVVILAGPLPHLLVEVMSCHLHRD